MLSVSSFWTDLFSHHFLEREDGKDDSRDDMLFYVKKIENGKGKGHLVGVITDFAVFESKENIAVMLFNLLIISQI